MKRIVIASILKPVDDSRMYEKISLSLSKAPQYEMHVIGLNAKSETHHPRIKFHPIFNFTRLSLKRLLAPLNFFLKVRSLNPDLLIICTHELLFAGWIYKKLNKCKLVYDIQENYVHNILFTKVFPTWLRPLIALKINIYEHFFSPAIDFFFLAEKTYLKELRFLNKEAQVIENKYSGKLIKKDLQKDSGQITLLFTGTLADHYGIFEAIELCHNLHQVNPKIHLKIIGYASQVRVLHKIKEMIGNNSYIELIGGNKPVSHSIILDEIRKADFGLISYQKNESTKNRMPTKIFEYIANNLPFLLCPNPLWVKYSEQFNACIPIDFQNYKTEDILRQMGRNDFYTDGCRQEVLWESEEPKLLETVGNLLNN
ncbi:glycosyltransferase [Xanthovirga aplysinae]|uniref:glycosyltransferase n=1 Tax=Xanthovirga aplysinae TaxID=2529853 RepID=UPI0012BC255F|nr:glycosyltransferase [Xanthovirga aplysinae]MTI30607.1 glycosyltransferase [Xanthovirga aplysinae]